MIPPRVVHLGYLSKVMCMDGDVFDKPVALVNL